MQNVLHFNFVMERKLIHFLVIITLHQMHEMHRPTVITDVRGVCLSVCPSVCLSRGLTRLHRAKTAERIEILFEVYMLGGPWDIVLHGSPDPYREGKGYPLLNFGTPLYLRNG